MNPLALAFLPLAVSAMIGDPRVLDGDTLLLGGRKVEVFGIEAPDLYHQCRNREGHYACGLQAKVALAGLLAAAGVSCRLIEIDSHDRPVARCLAGSRDIGAEMVRRGFARARRGGWPDYRAEEAEARAAGRGLWAGQVDPALPLQGGTGPARRRGSVPPTGGPKPQG